MGPSKEVVTANGMEEGGPSGVSCASMEKRQLLHYSCEIIGICCRWLGDHFRRVWMALHCVVQRDHVEVTGGVFVLERITFPFLVTWLQGQSGFTTMGTELRN